MVNNRNKQYLQVVSQLSDLLVLPLGALPVPVLLVCGLAVASALVLGYRLLREFERLEERPYDAHVVSQAHRCPQGRIHASRELRVPDHAPRGGVQGAEADLLVHPRCECADFLVVHWSEQLRVVLRHSVNARSLVHTLGTYLRGES